MMRKVLVAAVLACLFASLADAADKRDNVTVYVEYRHGPVVVHYAVPCVYKSTCSLNSLDGAEIPWRVEITPRYVANDIVAIETVVKENLEEVSRSSITTKLGEDAKIVSADVEGNAMELTIKPY